VPNENLAQAFGTRRPAAGFGSPDRLGKLFEFVTRFAEPKVSDDRSSDTRPSALSALGRLGCFRRRVVRSGGAVHRPDAPPRLARFRAVESGAAPASLFPRTNAFWIGDPIKNEVPKCQGSFQTRRCRKCTCSRTHSFPLRWYWPSTNDERELVTSTRA
jgi:hypothetical protein